MKVVQISYQKRTYCNIRSIDGTLFQETDPVYFDFRLYKYRVLNIPIYKDKATEHQKEVAHEIEGIFKTRIFPEGIVLRHAAVYVEVFKGMTLEEADKYVKDPQKNITI